MDLIKVKNASYGRYEELLLKRDQLYREAGSILTSYTQEFGELTTAVFEEKIACIRLKKAIAYCQGILNHGDTIDTNEMQSYLDKNMAMYYVELKQMLADNEAAREAKTASIADVQRAKKIYRKLAKMIHPDINPQTNQIAELADLWNRIVIAYHQNNPAELSELEVLVNKAISDLGIGMTEIEIPDIEAKIQKLEDEINEILTTEPYTFQELLDDEQAVREKKEALQKELDDYKKYHSELDEILNQLLADGGAHFVWRMN